VLRHHPEEVGLTLDGRGAVDLDALTQAIQASPRFEAVTREKIVELATTAAAAQRFHIEGNLIRARYGHTFAQAIEYEPADPPEFLFHGTTPPSAEQILTEGLKAAGLQRVHLSIDTPAAREVGGRQCPEPVVLRIDTECARKGGIKFYRGGPAVWLSDELPPECITKVE
jgi:putative RNA 2'-phosphotransferase